MSRIKVCMLSSAHGPFDDRIFFKEARTLSMIGYEVKYIVPAEKNRIRDGVQIISVGETLSRLKRMIVLPFKIFTKALAEQCHVCHFHDPELIPVGLFLKVLGKKVIYDAHEDVAGQIEDKPWIKVHWLRKLIAGIVTYTEKVSSFIFDAVIAATPFIAHKFPSKKTHVVRNLVILELVDKAKPVNLSKQKEHVVIYAGGLSRIRGIKELISAMELLDDSELWLLGNWQDSYFFEQCKSMPGWKNTRYLGAVNMDEVYSYLKKADLGIVLLYPNPNYLKSLPVKAFEYMAAGLPMVMSDFPFWRELFGRSALFADPFSPKDIASKIARILNDEELYASLSSAGRYMVEKEFNWERESQKLIGLYQKISKS